jgi:hypothetical protein
MLVINLIIMVNIVLKIVALERSTIETLKNVLIVQIK